MNQLYFRIIIAFSLILTSYLQAQTVTIDDPTLGNAATYTFTYQTSNTIGTGTITPNVFILSMPSGYPPISPSVGDSDDMDPYVTFKVDGTTYLCSESFGTVGGAYSSGIQLSVASATTGLTINAGSTIEITVTGLITNPSTSSSYTFNWRTAAGSGAATENFSDVVNFATLSTPNLTLDRNVTLYPNPSRDVIKLSGLSERVNYMIYDILGAQIKTGRTYNNEDIDIKNFASGPYFLKFDNGNTIKFIKE